MESLAGNSKLKRYYEHVYPFDELAVWLTRAGKPRSVLTKYPLSHREFSYATSDFIKRWISVSTISQFKAEVVRQVPDKFDIGAIYNDTSDSKENLMRKSCSFKPLGREFVIDIDMNDYDAVRTCCQGTKVCKFCWKFIAAAAEIIEATLREDFNFKEFLWVYSGRRGVHLWVSDPMAMITPNETRAAMIERLSFPTKDLLLPRKWSKNAIFNDKWSSVHGRRVYPILSNYFPLLLETQTFLTNPKHLTKINNYLTATTNTDIISRQKKNVEPLELWDIIQTHLATTCPEMDYCNAEIMTYFAYPKLDVNVSKDMGHMLKAPFVIHSGTGKVCLPMTLKDLLEFDPELCPSLTEMIDLDALDPRRKKIVVDAVTKAKSLLTGTDSRDTL